MTITLIAAAAVVSTASAAAVAALRRSLLKRQVVDVPNERSSHEVPTPRGGGLVIVVATLATAAVASATGQLAASAFAWIAGGLAIAIVSWIDDARGVSMALRLAVHTGAALLVVAMYGHWSRVGPEAWHIELSVLGVPLTALWIVGLTNAWNFMDGIDGIAAGCAVVAAIFLAILLPPGGATLIAIALGAASLGFLTRNWQPASIFMGDVGSAFIGYALASLPLVAGTADQVLLRSVLIAWPFIFDTVFTILRRAVLREPILKPHRAHLYQRLVIAGRSHSAVSSLYMALCLLGGVLALLIDRLPELLAIVVVAAAALCIYTSRVEQRCAETATRADQPRVTPY